MQGREGLGRHAANRDQVERGDQNGEGERANGNLADGFVDFRVHTRQCEIGRQNLSAE